MDVSTVDELATRIPDAMLIDRHRLRQMAEGIRRSAVAKRPFERDLIRFTERLEQSLQRREQRQANLPPRVYDPALPITAAVPEIVAAITQHRAIIVCGETGSGKSTQLPKICLDAGRGIEGLIGHTQPRRIAARSIAARLAEELGNHSEHGNHREHDIPEELGTPSSQSSRGGRDGSGYVGYKVRFTDTTKPEAYVKLMTDGILLAETQNDRSLDQYDTIIVDEAHERTLNVDFLLGYLRGLLTRRHDLRVIVTSATLDAERFAEHFSFEGRPAPIIEVSGRGYPVELRYRPLERDDEGDDVDLPHGIADVAAELAREGGGDMLVFLPTERDIRDVAKVLRGRSLAGGAAEVIPLYARLSAQEQNKVFQPHKSRRIVLATNVAESSLTVPNIRFVIDSGLARISRYSPRSKVQRLPIEPISQASADQRMGRCGRVGPGICVRLYSADDYTTRDRYPTPEIRRTNLAAVILQMLALKLGSVDEFPFLDPPRHESIRDGYKTLFELQAIDEHRRLTQVGRRLAQLPVDPRIGRMVLAAEQEHCLHEMLVIAAALETQDPRERPADRQQAADEKHAQWAHESSDFLTYLNLWDWYHRLKEELSRNQLQKACRQNFLSWNRMREWLDVHRQLVRLVEQAGLKTSPRRDDYDAIHRSLLAGLLANVAMRADRFEYQGAGNMRFQLWPGSSLFKNKPTWLVAAELVETTRRYVRTAARINPDWIEPLAGHLVKRSYSEPHWSRRRRSVMAYERVTLFGLTVVAQRPVRYGPLDPVAARRIFIQNALVEGLFDAKMAFYNANRQLLANLREEGDRARRADLFVPDHVLYEFYHDRLPEDVYDWATLRRWLDVAMPEEIERLQMRRVDLLPAAGDAAEAEFPDRYDLGEVSVPVDYRFQPGEVEDGLTLTVPREAVGRLDAERLDWLVPGLLEEKITALIRTLPKSIRRSLVPAPDTARQAAQMLPFGQGPFLPTIAQVLSRLAEEPIPPEAFDLDKLPGHLRFNVRVVDAEGNLVARGRDVNSLRTELNIATEATDEGVIADARWERDDIVHWDFGELPERVPVQRGAFALPAFPTLLDRGASVSLRLVDSLSLAERRTRAGVRRLFVIAEKRELRAHVVWLPHWDQMQRHAITLPHPRPLAEQVADLLADLALRDGALPRDAEQFAAACQRGRKQLSYAVQEASGVLPKIFENYHQVRLALDEARALAKLAAAVADLERQLADLLPEGFLAETPWAWLQQFPRYLQAILIRLERLRTGGQARDEQAMRELAPHLARYRQRCVELALQGEEDEALEEYRWMIEEFRVSLFAQQLGTSIKVSNARLEKQWGAVR